MTTAGSVWHTLGNLDAYRVSEVPRTNTPTTPSRRGDGDDHGQQRLAALVSAYHAGGGTVLLGWMRATRTGPVEVYVGGSALAGTADEDATILSLPAGARGHRVAPGIVGEAMAQMPHWSRVCGITDGLLADDEPRGQPEPVLRPSLEDCLLGVWRDPFAWLLIAEPVDEHEVDKIAGEVADQQRCAQSRAASSPEYAVDAQRLQRRHRELCQAASTGLWRAHLLAGAATPEAAARVAALLCASADLDGLPYALSPGRCADRLETILDTATDNGGAASPFHASSALLAAIAKPPAQEVPGLRFAARPDFDVTPKQQTGKLTMVCRWAPCWTATARWPGS